MSAPIDEVLASAGDGSRFGLEEEQPVPTRAAKAGEPLVDMNDAATSVDDAVIDGDDAGGDGEHSRKSIAS